MRSIFLIKWVNTCKLDLLIWCWIWKAYILKQSTIQCQCQVCKLYSCILFCQSEFILFVNQNKFGKWKSEHIFISLIAFLKWKCNVLKWHNEMARWSAVYSLHLLSSPSKYKRNNQKLNTQCVAHNRSYWQFL